MDKFSKIDKNKKQDSNGDEILYKDNYMKLIKYDGWSIVSEKDMVICIIHLLEENKIIIRQEYVPTYKYVDGQHYHITVISGGIEKGETPEEALLREIQEEAGIVLRDNFKIEFDKPIFVSKGCTDKYHPCILTLNENDYHEVMAKGDGSKEENDSKSVKVDLKYINSINSSDTITELMLMKLKKELNM